MTKIYGASDDLIEITGKWQGEIGCYSSDDEATFALACSDGTLLSVTYDGCWRFTLLVKGSMAYTKEDAEAEDRDGSRPTGEPWYSDVLTFDGDLAWVALAENGHYETARPVRRRA